ncbi:uncharacterized protein M421DRAFT_342091 [Didymella exigua CBS 183.55]|uniref:Uncharacterized protein n=1 Tax=Didymella exigua CBS 183.55 TaxID=1150837 RepID=A0A6A5RTN9_9PLEO|nr:uncharacterized protein M421DRAFT_342091 [Didymella exigua CBS 183.55]KAF1931212.1 hypothetical protein M421DRAFT_342091 [Didymella exigua CBS 183.55]
MVSAKSIAIPMGAISILLSIWPVTTRHMQTSNDIKLDVARSGRLGSFRSGIVNIYSCMYCIYLDKRLSDWYDRFDSFTKRAWQVSFLISTHDILHLLTRQAQLRISPQVHQNQSVPTRPSTIARAPEDNSSRLVFEDFTNTTIHRRHHRPPDALHCLQSIDVHHDALRLDDFHHDAFLPDVRHHVPSMPTRVAQLAEDGGAHATLHHTAQYTVRAIVDVMLKTNVDVVRAGNVFEPIRLVVLRGLDTAGGLWTLTTTRGLRTVVHACPGVLTTDFFEFEITVRVLAGLRTRRWHARSAVLVVAPCLLTIGRTAIASA